MVPSLPIPDAAAMVERYVFRQYSGPARDQTDFAGGRVGRRQAAHGGKRMASDHKTLQNSVLQASERADWAEVLALTADARLLVASPRLIKMRLIAAMETADLPALQSCVDATVAAAIAVGPALDKQVTIMAGRLERGGYADLAWGLLSHLPAPAPAHLSALRRLAQGHPDEGRRMVVAERRRAAKLAGTPGTDARATSSERPQSLGPFPSQRSREPGCRGVVDYVEAGTVGPAHKALFSRLGHSFADHLEARRGPPQITEYRDVYVNRDGMIWRRDGAILHGKLREGRSLPTDAAGAAEVQFAASGLTGTRGFYHWYVDCLLRLGWALPPWGQDLPLLINDDAKGFQRETYRLAGVSDSRLITVGEALFCRHLRLGRATMSQATAWGYFSGIYETLSDGAVAQARTPGVPAIYISRRDSNRRVLENEAELEEALARRGIVPMVFGTMTLADQIAAIRAAQLVVAPHGAGLAHLIAARPGLRVLELMPIAGAHHSLRFNFARISMLRGHRHTLWLEGINPVTQRWSADVAGVAGLAGSMASALEGGA